MDFEYFLNDFLSFFLVLSRVAGLMTLMPFITQLEISTRFRLFIILGFSYMIMPLIDLNISHTISYTMIASLMVKEALIGAYIGLIARLLLTMLDIAGTLISAQIGLSSATAVNPNMQGSTLISSMLSMFGVMVFLSLDLHHLVLQGFIESYALFKVDHPLMLDSFAKGYIDMFARVFMMGLQLSLPFVVVFIVMQIAFGLMNRIIPQMQIFFISLPFQLWAGLFIFTLVCTAMLEFFQDRFKDEFTSFFKF